MALTPGTRFGAYLVTGALGAGGMGEVYRARDERLNRDIAIKILPEPFAEDPERLARFAREAQTLAALNHPNIAQVHGLEEGVLSTPERAGRTTVRGLVMELVAGDDLSALIARGPMPLAEALPVATQIASGLEAAHEHGIVHRDLKPANIKVRADGTVKILDFGLAKALDPAGASNADAGTSPTLTARSTQLGVILGTAAYMAPEQARGKVVDRRADIWAFGVVLYEMLTGRRAFEGEEVSDVLAAVLRQKIDWSALPADTPPRVRRLLARCLDRDARQRLRDIGEARIALEAPGGAESVIAAAAVPAPPTRRWRWIAATAGMAAALAAGITFLVSRPAAPVALRVSIPLSAGTEYAIAASNPPNVAISPDGAIVAFVAMPLGGSPQESTLYLRRLGEPDARPVADSSGAQLPFFSPDNRWVAFLSGNALKKASVSGGAPTTLATGIPHLWGATWLDDGTILYANPLPNGDMLFSISDQGGPTALFSRVDRLNMDNSFPHPLDDGDLLVTMWTGGLYTDGKIARFSRAAGEATTVFVEGGSQGLVVAGQLVYARGEELFAQSFHADGRPSGAVKVLDGVLTDLSYATAQFAVSRSGTLVYTPASGRPPTASLVWVSPDGQTEVVLDDPRIETPRLSTDGRHVVFLSTQDDREKDLWAYDLSARRRSRLTNTPGEEYNPVVSADGRTIVFSAWRDTWGLHRTSAVGGAEEPVPVPRDRPLRGWSFSSDARWLAVVDDVPGPGSYDRSSADIGLLDLQASELTPVWLAKTPFREDQPIFSPAGGLLAYVSNQLGQPDVWLARVDEGVEWAPMPVSREGGDYPFWSGDGRTLFFTQSGKLLAVTVGAGDRPAVSEPREVMAIPNLSVIGVAPDGRFLVLRRERTPVTRLDLILNWSEELKARSR